MDVASSILLGAARWLHELSFRDEEGARLSLRTQPALRDLTPTQYEIALDWLKERQLFPLPVVSHPWTLSPGAQVLGAAIEVSTPPWLPDADSLIQGADELPIDVVELGEQLGLDPPEMYDEVRRVWRKFDDAARRALGSAGEAALVDWLHENVEAEVVRVSEFDDTAGFDIALLIGRKIRARIEVKATRRDDSVVLFLSRNEVETMRADESWCLQVVQLDAEDRIRSIGWVPQHTIRDAEPRDAELATWQSMKMTLPTHFLRPGAAPPIEALMAPRF